MNESAQRLWVHDVLWHKHVRACEQAGDDPHTAKSIVNIDCYSGHISKAFRQWFKLKYPTRRLVYVPPKCTARAQFADVVLNKPFKNYVSRQHTMHMMKRVQEQLAAGLELKDLRFEPLATEAAGPALKWMTQGYHQLAELSHEKGLKQIGYWKCWNDEAFIEESMQRAGELLQAMLPDVDLVAEPDVDEEDVMLAGSLLPGF